MRRAYKFILIVVILLAGAALSPFLVPPGLRLWISWRARHDGLTIKIDKIEAPFLKPVVLHGLRLTSLPENAFRVQLNVERAVLFLNLRGILSRSKEPLLRNVETNKLQLQVHRNESGKSFSESTWQAWQKLLPKACTIDGLDLRIEDGPTVILLRGGALSFSEIESGRVSAGELTIASPFVRRTYSELEGATHWQDNRLTLAGFTLTRGIDVQSVAFDLAHLNRQRLSVELDLDAFGGKIRGNASTEWRSDRGHWNIAASAADISLGQTAEAIGLADKIAGRLHACKFTFRGDAHNPMEATASVWTELTAPAWHDRAADLIMLGAALYNRQITVQQLYIKQDKNELTLSGETPLPEKFSDWLTADFRADITASIKNLGDFAKLFGRRPEEFAGDVSMDGTINSHARKIAGNLSATGNALRLFNYPVEQFAARLNMAENVIEISDFNLKRGKDYLSLNGKIDIANRENRYASIEASMRDISAYWPGSHLNAGMFTRASLTGDVLWLDILQLRGPGTIDVTGKIDIGNPKNIHATLTPIYPVVEVAPASAPETDCLDQLQIVLPSKETRDLPHIDQVDIDADYTGAVHQLIITTGGIQKWYRLFCPEVSNRPLQLAEALEGRR